MAMLHHYDAKEAALLWLKERRTDKKPIDLISLKFLAFEFCSVLNQKFSGLTEKSAAFWVILSNLCTVNPFKKWTSVKESVIN